MFIGTVFEITDILPSARMRARAKGFETIQTLLVSRLENVDSITCNGGRKYERWCKSSHGQSTPVISSKIASSDAKIVSK